MDKWNGTFASQQLEKFGWAQGEGLGKNKSGNVKHIAVSVKNDKKGVGVNNGQWEFAWWDHLYNKSANSVVVEKDDTKGEIKVACKPKGETRRSRTGIISTERPTGKSVEVKEKTEITTTMTSMASMTNTGNMMDSVIDIHANMAQRVASASLYGSFVKSAPTPDESDDELKDYSTKISDAELFAACEGRTARKGGRGLVDQTGKFKRVMQDYVRPDEEETDNTNTKKRKRIDDTDNVNNKEEKKKRKEERALRKEAKAVKKAAKAEKKEAKAEKKEAKAAAKTEKAAKKAVKAAKKAAKAVKIEKETKQKETK